MHSLRVYHGAVAILLGVSVGLSAAPLPTNLDMVMGTIEQAVDQALSGMDAEADSSVWQGLVLVAPQTKHGANWVVDHILTEQLLSRGVEVALDTTRAEPGGSRLSYRVLDLGITGKSSLWRAKVLRQSRATLALRVSSTDDGSLRWQAQETALQSDRVPKKMVEQLQTTTHKFAATDLEEQSWGKFVEPAIVSTVLGGLVYLFFSNR